MIAGEVGAGAEPGLGAQGGRSRSGASGPASVSTIVRFEADLRRFIARRVPGPDADDVLQDTLLRIHLGLGSLRDRDRLAAWVYRVARSAILDHHRRRAAADARGALPAAGAFLEEEVESGAASLPETPPEDLRVALAACVAPFLGSLPADQAEALRLTDLAGLTQAEAASRLGVPLPKLKARVQRGRRRMRAEFEACCHLGFDARGAVMEAAPRCAGGCG